MSVSRRTGHAAEVRPLIVLLLSVLLWLAGCGSGDDEPRQAASDDAGGSPSTPDDAAEPADDAPTATSAKGTITGLPSLFEDGGGGAVDLDASVEGRECVLAETLPLTCRAATGTGGGFVVTAEGVADAPGDFNVVVRCGLTPAAPVASASGPVQPITTDLGLAPYGEVVGVTLIADDVAEAALVYLPDGTGCPVVWGLGPVDPGSFLTGGTDALNGEEAPIRFSDATGRSVCAEADGEGGIAVTSARGDACD